MLYFGCLLYDMNKNIIRSDFLQVQIQRSAHACHVTKNDACAVIDAPREVVHFNKTCRALHSAQVIDELLTFL